MVVAFTRPTTVEDRMNAVGLIEQEDIKLNASDRCDSCGAQAYVMVLGMFGELVFCAHHYSKILSTESGKEAMNSFAYQIIDERSRLSESK